MSLHPKLKTKTKGTVKNSGNLTPEPTTQPTKRHWLWRIVRLCFRKWFLVTLLILLLIGLGFYLSQPRFYHILIIGSDQRTNERARSDVLMVLSIPKSKHDPMSLITIPRDTKIDHPEKGLQKITHFYAMWDDTTERLGNAQLTQRVVEDLLDTKMDGVVEFTFDSFTDIVNLVGGVETDQGHLDGQDAQELVHNRFVQPNGDFGRAAEQRNIFKDVMVKAKQPMVAKQIYDYLLTSDRARLNVSQSSLVSFGIVYLINHHSLEIPELEEVVLAGEGERIYTPSFGKSLYYWILDDQKLKEIEGNYLK